jgi:type VI secretion system secreted protein Hcp
LQQEILIMAIDTHIKFDGVEGEATHVDHKGEIEVLSWSWNVHNAGPSPGGGSGTGKAVAGQLNFMHTYDKASPVLAKKCAQGVHFSQAVITARKSGEGQKDFLKITMKEVFVTSVAPSGSVDGGIAEGVAMSYGAIDFSYKPQDSAGRLGAEVNFGWDVKANKIT